ncbi:hypothetical protein [Planctomicrobium sp. SH527]|uniref:hypothetical protein n=1 Tax=Planctomicrobium sp. SH527 TaxID=3448123 RepID=UPI003F5C33F4
MNHDNNPPIVNMALFLALSFLTGNGTPDGFRTEAASQPALETEETLHPEI